MKQNSTTKDAGVVRFSIHNEITKKKEAQNQPKG